MSHEALYRKYRPKTFSELMGQDAINRTLTNAIGTKQVAHAYLFCGPRGTGKTSTARLLAKTLNCETGGTEPCNRCSNCLDIAQGASMDVIEIDAASNRGIDDVRALREQVRFAAVGGRFKVYIIDECHQLSSEAVNALLKTLEEPPDNVVFVLATTEANKVLPTIQSRCQRFDFQRIAMPVLLQRLQYVAEAEAIPVSAVSLNAIARRAAGGLRDALTLLDQVAGLAIDGMPISDELVLQVLGEVRAESLLAMGGAILAGDVVGLWQQAGVYLQAGYDPQTLLRELMLHLRNLMIVQVAPGRAVELEIAGNHIGALTDQAAQWTQPDLLYCLELLNETADRLRRSTHDQIWLEAGLARLCQRQTIASMLDLQARVDALERRAGVPPGARPAAPAQPAPARPAAPPPAPAVTAAPQPVESRPVAVPELPRPVDPPAMTQAAPALQVKPAIEPLPVPAIVIASVAVTPTTNGQNGAKAPPSDQGASVAPGMSVSASQTFAGIPVLASPPAPPPAPAPLGA
ncbi:MAG: DNA polymerase III subunit gamma/tau, partial [Candidatus Sericytochromatia bacterium]|nr:DNA polymerase III subunit gamma/tau [Candidatus Sericytochromatia bacterium]